MLFQIFKNILWGFFSRHSSSKTLNSSYSATMYGAFPKITAVSHPECLTSSSRLVICLADTGKIAMPLSILIIPPTCHCQNCRAIRNGITTQCPPNAMKSGICQFPGILSENTSSLIACPIQCSYSGCGTLIDCQQTYGNMALKGSIASLGVAKRDERLCGICQCTPHGQAIHLRTLGSVCNKEEPSFPHAPQNFTLAPFEQNFHCSECFVLGKRLYESLYQGAFSQMHVLGVSKNLPSSSQIADKELGSNWPYQLSSSVVDSQQKDMKAIQARHGEPICSDDKQSLRSEQMSPKAYNKFSEYSARSKSNESSRSSLPSSRYILDSSSECTSDRRRSSGTFEEEDKGPFRKQICHNQSSPPLKIKNSSPCKFGRSERARRRERRTNTKVRDSVRDTLPVISPRTVFLQPATQETFVYKRSKRYE